MAKRHFLVSTDSGGLFWPHHIDKQWDFLKTNPSFKGFEMIGWSFYLPNWVKKTLKQAVNLGYPVKGIHGRIGYPQANFSGDYLLNYFLHYSLISTSELIKIAHQLEYILIHQQEFSSLEVQKLILKNREKINFLYLENDRDLGSVAKAEAAVKELTRIGLKSGLMFDLCHSLTSWQGLDFNQAWYQSLQQLDNILHQGIKVGLHLPLGLRQSDSLPFEKISDYNWHNLADVLGSEQVEIVLENQTQMYQFLWPSFYNKMIRQRNYRIIQKLTSMGVI